MSSKERTQSAKNFNQHSKRGSTATVASSSNTPSSASTPRLPDKIDTQKVVDMIRNADLYDLINISLRSSELKNETVELFIQKALSKNNTASGGQKSQSQNSTQNILQQMILQQQQQQQQQENNENIGLGIFTPPTKSQRYQQHNDSHKNSNVENHVPMGNDDFPLFLKQQQQLMKLQLQHQQRQTLLQPSILENSQIPNNFQHQLSLSCQQLEEFLMLKRLSLDEDTGFQFPRDQIPQPYSDQPTSPGEDQNNLSFSQQQQQLQQIDSVMQSNQKPQGSQQLQTVHEVNISSTSGYKGDQFSFQYKKRESIIKKSPTQSNSNYSSQKQHNEQSFRNSSSAKMSPKSRNYEQQLKLQHSLKYQQQQVNPEEKLQLTRTLSNFRMLQQQPLQQQALIRSVTPNALQNKTPTQRSSQQPTLSSTSKSFLNTSRAQPLDQDINVSSTTTKTPRGLFNQQQSATGLLTSRGCASITPTTLDQTLTPSSASINALAQNLITDIRKSIDTKRSKLLTSFQQMNIKYLIELERIKKPSQLAYVTGRLVCQFFAIFKDSNINNIVANGQTKLIHMEDLIEWVEIQKHINSQIIKYTNELLSNVKSRVVNYEINNIIGVNAQKETMEQRLQQLKDEYFTGENMKLFKHLSTNKTLQVIVTFIYNVIVYYLDMIDNERQQLLYPNDQQPEIQRNSELRGILGLSRVESKQTFDTSINSTSTKASAAKQTNLHQYTKKQPSRNLQLPNKNDAAPTIGVASTSHSFIGNQTLDKSPLNSSKQQQLQEKQQTLLKSASRCLLQRRDRSQLIQKDQTSYCSNKSPMAKNATIKDLNAHSMKQSEPQSARRQDGSIQKRSNSRQQLATTSAKSPINIHHYSASRLPKHQLDSHKHNEIKERLSQIVEQQQEFTQRNSINMFFPIDFNQDLNTEAPLDFDYKLMVEGGSLSQLIKETSEIIEKNMMKVQGNGNLGNASGNGENDGSQRKGIDMGLIEQIKQRRVEQKQREQSEERCGSTSNRLSCKKLLEQL